MACSAQSQASRSAACGAKRHAGASRRPAPCAAALALRAPARCSRPRSCVVAASAHRGEDAAGQMTRRALTLVAPTGLLLGACSPALATLVTEPEFTIDAPAGWERAEGAASGAVSTRKVVVFHPPGDLETNVNIITTLASVELTKLSALGSAYEFGFRLVVSQDRRSRRVGSQAAELLNTEDRDGYYLVEYTLQRPDDNIDRHLYSYVALKSSGGYNKFYTVTGQYRAADKEKFDKLVADCVTSFRLTV